MAINWASRRVGRKGERRADEVGLRMVPLVIPAVRGTASFSATEGLRRVAIAVWEMCKTG